MGDSEWRHPLRSHAPACRAGAEGEEMKRDLDLIREIMLALENASDLNGRALLKGTASEFAQLDGREDDELAYHLMQIIDERWVVGEYLHESGDFALWRLTADGHDFIDSTRKPDVWTKAKSTAKSGGTESLRVLWDIAKAILKAEALRRLGST
jgi:hypothetical protein